MKVVTGGHCSACFNSQPIAHVDLGAAYDGPVLEGGVSIDDLILCQNCVASAAAALAIADDADTFQGAINDRVLAESRADKWEVYAKELEAALRFRPEPVTKTGRRRAA